MPLPDPFAPLDLYCERLGPGLLAEPLNAFSNLGFFVAAWAGWRLLQPGRAPHHEGLALLPWLAAGIGAGSLCFHTVAEVWAAYFDSGFIALYMVAFASLWARHVLGLPWRRAWLGAPLFAAFTGVTTLALIRLRLPLLPSDVTLYVSAWVVIGMMVLITLRREHAAARGLIGTLLLFSASLTARQIDLPLCSHWPWGTHWAWHLLNATALYVSMRALAAWPGPSLSGSRSPPLAT